MMNSTRMFLLLGLSLSLWLFPSMAVCENQQSQTQDSSGPIATVNTFLVALGNADADGIAATIAEDATAFLTFPGAPSRLKGRAQIQAAFVPFLDRLRAKGGPAPYLILEPKDLEVQQFDSTAIVTFHLGDAAGTEGGVALSRRTFVLCKVGGKWLIIHLHASNVIRRPDEKEQ